MRIAIGSDHAGYKMKSEIITFLFDQAHTILDKGCFSDERADYPDYAHSVAIALLNGDAEIGILICGSGNGINMTANKHKGIRSALCWTEEVAALARQHNDANIIALPARFISSGMAISCIRTFLAAEFEGGRHGERIKKIDLVQK